MQSGRTVIDFADPHWREKERAKICGMLDALLAVFAPEAAAGNAEAQRLCDLAETLRLGLDPPEVGRLN